MFINKYNIEKHKHKYRRVIYENNRKNHNFAFFYKISQQTNPNRKLVTRGRIRGRDGAEIPLVAIRTRRSCKGNCRDDEEEESGAEKGGEEEEAAAARRVARSELSEGGIVDDADTETAICEAFAQAKLNFPRKSEKWERLSALFGSDE